MVQWFLWILSTLVDPIHFTSIRTFLLAFSLPTIHTVNKKKFFWIGSGTYCIILWYKLLKRNRKLTSSSTVEIFKFMVAPLFPGCCGGYLLSKNLSAQRIMRNKLYSLNNLHTSKFTDWIPLEPLNVYNVQNLTLRLKDVVKMIF